MSDMWFLPGSIRKLRKYWTTETCHLLPLCRYVARGLTPYLNCKRL